MNKWLIPFTLFNILVLLLVALLSRDPFSGRNAISELEPSPDAIHYLSPVKSVWEGHGFAISYEGRSIPTLVPPLYSLTLIPFYGLFHDIRSFYFLNVFLIILSSYIFLKVIFLIFSNKLIQILVFFGFCTNFILFWYPSFPMAENLLILLTTISFLLLTGSGSRKKAILVGLIAGLMYATKYVAWVEGMCLVAVYLFQIWQTRITRKNKLILGLLSISTLVIVLLSSLYFEYLTKGSGIITSVFSNLKVVTYLVWHSGSNQEVSDQTSLFYHAPFGDNLVRYFFGLVGGAVTIAGQEFILVPSVIGFGAIMAVFMLGWGKINRLPFFYITCSLVLTLLYLSSFQTVDARYFFAFIPGLILLFGFGLQNLTDILEKFQRANLAKLLQVLMVVALLVSAVPSLVQGFRTNLTHSDASQNFQTISTMNNYFLSHHFETKPTVVTILSPYQVDFFSSHAYNLLPLSKIQYFTKSETQTWGIPDNLNYPEIYNLYLDQKRPLFVSTHHTGKEFIFWRDLQVIFKNFQLTKVADGCNGECDLYQIDSSKANPPY